MKTYLQPALSMLFAGLVVIWIGWIIHSAITSVHEGINTLKQSELPNLSNNIVVQKVVSPNKKYEAELLRNYGFLSRHNIMTVVVRFYNSKSIIPSGRVIAAANEFDIDGISWRGDYLLEIKGFDSYQKRENQWDKVQVKYTLPDSWLK